MTFDRTVQIAVTILALLGGSFYGVRVLTRVTRGNPLRWDVVDDVLHVVMSLAMAAMVWPWGSSLSPALSVVVFTGAALWFLGRALFARPGVTGDPAREDHHSGMRVLLYHTVMMGSMAWMAVAMAGVSGSPGAAAIPATSGMPAMNGMAGMDMGATPTGGAVAGIVPRWISAPCAGLALFFVLAVVGAVAVVARRAVLGARIGPIASSFAAAVMAAGMALMFFEMA